MAQHAEAKCVHERIAFVRFVEINLARDGRDAEAIAVMRNAADDAGEQTAVVGNLLAYVARHSVRAVRRRAEDCPPLPSPFVIGPNRSEFTAQIGRAPIVKISRTMPPTPVVAP